MSKNKTNNINNIAKQSKDKKLKLQTLKPRKVVGSRADSRTAKNSKTNKDYEERDTKEIWSKMAVAIANCLKAHTTPVCHSTLVKTILDNFPEYRKLQTARAGKLPQSKFTNAMGWAKGALKQGGYTISKKDSVAGEILMLTNKGRKTNLNRAAKNSWGKHLMLIKNAEL